MSRDVPHPGALGIARRYLAAGFSVVPILADGSKRPALSSWKPYQKRPPTEQELRAWWGSGGNGGAPLRGFALIHGAVSGHSEVLDFDAPDAWDEFLSRAEAEGWSDLVAALLTVATPSGGRHLYYRCLEGSGVAGNQKLARAADGTVRIETRGEGGYTLAPGSPALCHPDHRPYRILSGRFDAVPVVTAEERAALLELARAGDRLVANPATASTTFLLSPRPSLLSPRLAEARHPSLASERGGSTPAVKRCPSGLSDKPSPPLSLAREGWRASGVHPSDQTMVQASLTATG